MQAMGERGDASTPIFLNNMKYSRTDMSKAEEIKTLPSTTDRNGRFIQKLNSKRPNFEKRKRRKLSKSDRAAYLQGLRFRDETFEVFRSMM